jgi:predicted nuclease of restriction endonuclease-like RecB superfamily
VVVGVYLFLPEFTIRHTYGRVGFFVLVGFWRPVYVVAMARKVAAAHLDHLILVVYRGLAVGGRLDALTSAVTLDRVVWFTKRPRAADVLRVAERCARR